MGKLKPANLKLSVNGFQGNKSETLHAERRRVWIGEFGQITTDVSVAVAEQASLTSLAFFVRMAL